MSSRQISAVKYPLFVFLFLLSLRSEAISIGFVGHSLLNDDTCDIVQELFDASGNTITGYECQSIPGAPLEWNRDNGPDSDGDDLYVSIPSNPPTTCFDHLIITPRVGELDFDFPNPPGTDPQQAAALDWHTMLATACPTSQLWMLQTWQCVPTSTGCPEPGIVSDWPDQIRTLLASWESGYIDYVNANKTGGPDMKLIPYGQTMADLWEACENSEVAGCSPSAPVDWIISGGLTDGIHPERYVLYMSALAIYSAVLNSDPGLNDPVLPNSVNGQFGPPPIPGPTAANMRKFEELAWAAWQTYSGGGFPALNAVTGLSDPSVAYGTSIPADWDPAYPFLNLMKTGRLWIANLAAGGTMDSATLNTYLDQNGYPAQMPPGVNLIYSIFDMTNFGYGFATDFDGRYVLTYDGTGTVSVPAGTNVSSSAGRIEFDLAASAGTFSVEITATTQGDHIRNISLVKLSHEPIYLAGAVFNPAYLSKLGDARQLRFMNSLNIGTATTATEWNDRRQVSYYTYNEEWPLEIVVRLCNEIGSDCWINVPLEASDEYVTNMTTYIRDNLNTDLQLYLEVSNEVWNFILPQSGWAIANSIALWGNAPNGYPFDYYGMRVAQVMTLATAVYSGQMTRINRVLAGQTGWPAILVNMLTAPEWQANDPGGYIDPRTVIDVIAGANYFGGDIIQDEADALALVAQIEGPGDQAADNTYHYNYLTTGSPSKMDDADNFYDAFIAQANTTAPGKRICSYEGGQHIHHGAYHANITAGDQATIAAHLHEFVRSDLMDDLYAINWAWVQANLDCPYNQYTGLGFTAALPGTWGQWQSVNDTTPRATYLEVQNAAVPPWWESRGGEHFQEGITGGLIGSNRIDYLTGTTGDDEIYPGPDNDGVNGGLGTDTVLLSGTQGQYTIVAENGGFRVTGPDGSDFLRNVETLRFSDLSEIPLAAADRTNHTISFGGGAPVRLGSGLILRFQ